jgi:chaperonin GroES
MNLKPLADRLIIEPIEQESFTPSGIMLPETAKEKPMKGKVLATGPGARQEDGARIAMDVCLGDTVLYAKYGRGDGVVEVRDGNRLARDV